MTEVTLTFDMISFDKDMGECIALLNGREIIVDPYVGCAWEYPYFKTGKVTFEGHWYKSDTDKIAVFLPSKEVDTKQIFFPRQLCASCQKELFSNKEEIK